MTTTALKEGALQIRRILFAIGFTGLISVAHTEIAILAWDPSESPNTAGYNVYYGTSSGNYVNTVDVGNALTAQIGGLVVGNTYYFVVTAYNDAGLESVPSNEIQFTPLFRFLGHTLTMQSDGKVQVRLSAPMGIGIILQTSTNLVNWKSIATNTVTSGDGIVTLTDNSPGKGPVHLYRAYVIDNSAAPSLLNAITLLK